MTGDRLAGDDPHIAQDLTTGQGIDEGPDAIPAADLAELAAIRDPADQGDVAFAADEVEAGEAGLSDTRIYEGYLEAGVSGPGATNGVDLPGPLELRAGETDNPDEAAEEGLAWIAPVDPPVVAAEDGGIEVAAGFGTTADDEPYDADHHRSFELADDERTERVREALLAHAETTGLVERLVFETVGSQVVVEGVVDDIDDEDAIVAVIEEVDGVSEVLSRIRVAAAE